MVQRTLGAAAGGYAVALVQPHPHLAGNIPLRAGDIGVQIPPVRREPEAVVHQVGVFLRYPFLETRLLAGQRHRLQRPVRRVQRYGGRRFVHFPRLDAHQPVLHMVNAPDAVAPGQPVQMRNQVHAGHPFAVQGHRDALLKADFHIGRRIGGGAGVRRPFVGVLRRLRPGILQFAGLGAAAPQVFVGAVLAVGRGDGQVALPGVLHLVLPVHPPLADGGDNRHAGREGSDAHLNANLVVALAGAAVGDGRCAVLLRRLGQAAGNQRPAQRRRQRILPLVDGAGPQRRPQKFINQRRARIHGNRIRCAHGISALPDGFQVNHPQVNGAGDDLGIVIFLEPGYGNGGIQSAGIGKDDFLAWHTAASSFANQFNAAF